MRILQIDAWREPAPGSWTWNNWHHVGDTEAETLSLPPRKLFAKLRAEGYRMPVPGYAAVEDDGRNLTIIHRHTGEPVLAIEYGST